MGGYAYYRTQIKMRQLQAEIKKQKTYRFNGSDRPVRFLPLRRLSIPQETEIADDVTIKHFGGAKAEKKPRPQKAAVHPTKSSASKAS